MENGPEPALLQDANASPWDGEKNYDVVVVGTGVAGLYAAINLPQSLRVLVISKRDLRLCNSALAQGGVAAVYLPEDDTTQLHTNDTLIAGGFKNNLDAIKILVGEAAQDIEKIISLGVDFDKNPDGTYHKTLEGGHSRRRIFHHKDATGAELVDQLLSAVQQMKNVSVMDNVLVCDIKKTGTGFSLDLQKNQTHSTVNCHYCVLGTGGIGRVYEYTTNSAIATGDGIAFAYQMGASIKNLHLVQFHPTAFSNRRTRECFLISEAVRGEGAYLLNCHGERFMQRYDERLELAPRDVVSHAIMEEAKVTGSEDFYLDITHKDPQFLRQRFPMIYQNLLEQGFDLTTDRIPIFPCQHYLMGGVNVNVWAQSDVEGLYAVGECSHTGVHGNNRLASNSLLEALVFSRRAAEDIARKASENTDEYETYPFVFSPGAQPMPHGYRTEIRHIMQKGYFVIPDKQAALAGYERILELKKELENGNYIVEHNYVEAKALATVAYLILKEVI